MSEAVGESDFDIDATGQSIDNPANQRTKHCCACTKIEVDASMARADADGKQAKLADVLMSACNVVCSEFTSRELKTSAEAMLVTVFDKVRGQGVTLPDFNELLKGGL